MTEKRIARMRWRFHGVSAYMQWLRKKSTEVECRLWSFAFLLVICSLVPAVYAAQTCTVVNTISSIPAPTNAKQMFYSATYGRLIIRNSGSAIESIDVGSGQATIHLPNRTFTDMAISPSGRYIFGADYGGENIGYGTPSTTSYVHRLDLATGVWETRSVYIAGGIQAVSDDQFILKSIDQWVTFTNNAWGTGPAAILLNTSNGFFGAGSYYYASVYFGDFRYDAISGRLLHGNSNSSSSEIQAFRLVGNDFVRVEGSGTYGSANAYGGTVALATDGSAFYYGRLQVDPLDVTFNRKVFPDLIYAATGNVAFGNGKFFDAHTGNFIGNLGFDATAYALNPAGDDFWAFDASQNLLRRMTFSSATCTTPPPAPVGVSATVNPGTNNIVISWNGSVAAAGYNIYMARQSGITKANYTSLGGQIRLNVTSPYTELSANSGTYYLVVTAFNDFGEGTESTQVSVTIPDIQAPSVPTGLTATAFDWSTINLSWNAALDNVGVSSYQIYRGDVLRGVVPASQLTFTEGGLSASTLYTYSVKACDAAVNCSAPSVVASATTPVRTTPNQFFFNYQTSVPRGSLAVSDSTTVSGVGVPVAISIVGGEYSINGGAFTAAPGTITSGQNVVVRLTSSSSYGSTKTATLTIGGVSANFQVTTETINGLQYFPLALGNSWRVRVNGATESTSTVATTQVINGHSTTGISNSADGSIAYYSSNGSSGVTLHRVFAPAVPVDGCGTVTETDTFNTPVTILPTGGAIGSSYGSNGILIADLGNCGNFSFGYGAASMLQSFERMTVPAGQFDALKVNFLTEIAGERLESIFWFAAGIGQIKELDSDGTISELVSTNIMRTLPDDMVFSPQSNVPVQSTVTSNSVTITGITAPSPISIAGGMYSINGGAFTNQSGSVTNGQTVLVRLTSSAQGNANTSATITVGGVATMFSVTTNVGAPSAPTVVKITAGSTTINVTYSAPASNGGSSITGYSASCTSSNGGISGTNAVAAGATSIAIVGLTNGARYTCTVTASNVLGVSVASIPSNEIVPIDLTPIWSLLLD